MIASSPYARGTGVAPKVTTADGSVLTGVPEVSRVAAANAGQAVFKKEVKSAE